MALILSCATGQDQWAITDLTRRFPMKSALKRVVLVLLLLSVTVVAAYTGPTDSALAAGSSADLCQRQHHSGPAG